MIKNYIKPYDDEFLFSWLNRIAEANAIPLSVLLKTEFNYDTNSDNYSRLDFEKIANTLNTSIIDLLKNNTTYYSLAPFMSEYSKDIFIQSIANKKYNIELFSKSYIVLSSNYKVCPICAKKKLIKNSHMLPGVTCCLEHKVKLITKDRHINSAFDGELEVIKATKKEIRYAEFANEFNKLKPSVQINASNISKHSINFINEINKMMKECDSPSEISNYLKKYKTKNNIKEYVCSTCGTKYISTEKGNKIYGCPNCLKDKSATQIIEEMCAKSDYKVVGDFHTLALPIRVRKMGAEIDIMPKRLLQYVFYTTHHNKTNRADFDENFIVKRIPPNMYKITCKKCGGTFTINRNSFKKREYCRLCGYLKDEIISYPKHKYTFIDHGKYSNYSIFKCKKCGFEFKVEHSKINDDMCPFCHPSSNMHKALRKLYDCYGNNVFDSRIVRKKFNLPSVSIVNLKKYNYITKKGPCKYYVHFKPKNKI